MRNEWPESRNDIQHAFFDKLFNLDGEVAIVTGGMGLLGSQYVMTLMKAGANVVALDLKDHFADDVAKLAREMCGLGHWMAGQAWTCDITNRKEIQGFFKWMEEAERGTPTILINNAGMDSRPDAPASDNGLFENYSEYRRMPFILSVLSFIVFLIRPIGIVIFPSIALFYVLKKNTGMFLRFRF